MLILGIDPGSLRAGWGVVEEQGSKLSLRGVGVIKLPAREPLAVRLGTLHAQLTGIVASYAPARVVIESVFHGVNSRSLITLGEARGVAMAAAGAAGVEVLALSPAEVKKAVTGNGAATKSQVAHMVGVLLGPEARNQLQVGRKPVHALDATDALAAAIAGLRRTGAASSGSALLARAQAPRG
ncbi:MAG: crossover junction endodeoxyribonuclease RuvC [Planctomycetota bacterium]